MNRRGKRLTLGVMAVGLGVVIVLAIAHGDTVRDHVEAWHFQLTKKTEMIEPAVAIVWPSNNGIVRLEERELCRLLATFWGQPVIHERGFPGHFLMNLGSDEPWGDLARRMLVEKGYRVLEQRFPRRAFVVVAGPERSFKVPASRGGQVYLQSDWKITEGSMSATYGGGGKTEP